MFGLDTLWLKIGGAVTAVLAIIGAIAGVRRSGYKQGTADADLAQRKAGDAAITDRRAVDADVDRLSGDDARKRLRDNWSRPG